MGKKVFRLIGVLLALTMLAASLSACGGPKKYEVAKTKLENPKIKWLAHYPLNSAQGKKQDNALILLKEIYGGEVEDIVCSWADRYTKLAQMVNSGEAPDATLWEVETYPAYITKNLYQPVDSYLDLDSDLWKGTKPLTDAYAYMGKHYMAAVGSSPSRVMFYYRKSIVEAAGLEDPYTLYKQGKWDWNTFKEMVTSFADPQNKIYGITGNWPVNGLAYTTGVSVVSRDENFRLTNNLKDPRLERAMNFAAELKKAGVVEEPQKANTFVKGNALFYADGDWMYGGILGVAPQLKGDLMQLPPPKDPEADKYFIHTFPVSLTIVKGAKNPEGAAALLTCMRLAKTWDQFINPKEYNLTDLNDVNDPNNIFIQQSIDIYKDMEDLTKFTYPIDMQYGLGPDGAAMTYGLFNDSYRGDKPWSTIRDTYYNKYQDIIDKLNADIEEAQKSQPQQ